MAPIRNLTTTTISRSTRTVQSSSARVSKATYQRKPKAKTFSQKIIDYPFEDVHDSDDGYMADDEDVFLAYRSTPGHPIEPSQIKQEPDIKEEAKDGDVDDLCDIPRWDGAFTHERIDEDDYITNYYDIPRFAGAPVLLKQEVKDDDESVDDLYDIPQWPGVKKEEKKDESDDDDDDDDDNINLYDIPQYLPGPGNHHDDDDEEDLDLDLSDSNMASSNGENEAVDQQPHFGIDVNGDNAPYYNPDAPPALEEEEEEEEEEEDDNAAAAVQFSTRLRRFQLLQTRYELLWESQRLLLIHKRQLLELELIELALSGGPESLALAFDFLRRQYE